MGFLWADFELQMDTKSIRYVNDLVWYYYSVIGFFPLVFITIYKLLINPVNLKPLDDVKSMKRRWDDYIIVPFVYHGELYYFIDLILSTYEDVYLMPCRFSLWFHHIISVVVLSKLLTKKIYFWWEAAIPAMHALLVYDSTKLILYSYVALVIFFNIKCYLPPYNKLQQFRFIGKFFPPMYYCFFLMYYHECSSPLPNLS